MLTRLRVFLKILFRETRMLPSSVIRFKIIVGFITALINPEILKASLGEVHEFTDRQKAAAQR